MRKKILYIFFSLCCTVGYAQKEVLWKQVNAVSVSSKKAETTGSEKLYFTLNSDLLTAKLGAVLDKTTSVNAVEITFPNSEGVLERFSVWESSNFEPELQAKYPEIRSYEGKGIDDKAAKIHFSVAPIGVQTMVFRPEKPTEYIEQNTENKSQYVFFKSTDNAESKMLLECKTANLISESTSNSKTAKTAANTKQFRTFRLALSCTAEYTTYFGGTKAAALAGMNATMTRVNGVFNKDLALKLVLIANNDAVIYTDASTDPYSVASTGANGAWGQELQTTLTNTIGNANYDIGHLFGAAGGGGNANCIGCVCVNPTTSVPLGKGSAFTSPSNQRPQGDTFDIDYVAHEMGHQLGATHTFSYDLEGSGTNVEPGSGSTIMAYAGVTRNYDVQSNSDDYFAYASIIQIQNNLANKSCAVITSTVNNPPVIDAGLNYTIPISTPFILTGTGSDPEGNTITYTWEQYDNATSTSGANSIAYATKPNGPLFRSFAPTTSPVRYMPALSSVLNNTLTTRWESVSSIAKTMNFTLTGRDNAADGTAQTQTDAMIVTVNASAGPFAVTSQNTENIGWDKGSSQTITWSVNNTTSLSGSANVNIKLSTDGGLTFPIILAANTPNDGSETITVPTSVDVSTNCRIWIQPTDNIYYAVNSKPFAIGYTVTTNCNSYSFASSFTIPSSSTYGTRTVSVPASTGTVSDVNVSVNVTHDRMSDVDIQILSPSGTIVQLFNKNCSGSSNTNLVLQYDDDGVALDCSKTTTQIIVPVDYLSAFIGQNPQGTWTLRARDTETGQFGTINSASINICNKTTTLGTADFENVAFVLYPNPNQGSFTISFESESQKGVQIVVHDILGKRVYDKTFENTGTFNQNIQLQNAASGIYLVTVIDGERRTVKKVVVN
ncbi:reprolysin-like metallopeptidase [Flavobacterium artemisiae]|uniref:Reprolysin-like metallopeptidase n=1 Tax=Flavobacterium artemisiae TaxID=2126556 RepID=A0ABW4H8C2_9FLAO